jgi:hypothetical protein
LSKSNLIGRILKLGERVMHRILSSETCGSGLFRLSTREILGKDVP